MKNGSEIVPASGRVRNARQVLMTDERTGRVYLPFVIDDLSFVIAETGDLVLCAMTNDKSSMTNGKCAFLNPHWLNV
jgi:hypothetical protein